MRACGSRKVCHKPGSVLPVVSRTAGAALPRMEATIIFLGRPLLDGSSDQPERTPGQGRGRAGRRVPFWSCSGWGLPGTKSPVFLVVSYTTVPPLPVPPSGGHRRSVSVALSFGSRRLDVIQHPALWSPDFPPAARSRERLSVKLSGIVNFIISRLRTVGNGNGWLRAVSRRPPSGARRGTAAGRRNCRRPRQTRFKGPGRGLSPTWRP